MPHDEHFLSRLDRLSLPLVEFALTLYRDAQLVKVILRGARAPESAPRVALSLDHPTEGPFVVVARDGGFVTCLGAGMSPAPHPVVTRAQIDAQLQRLAVARDRAETAQRLIGRRSGAGVLLERLYTAGEFLSREEIFALGLWQPLLRPTMLALYHAALASVDTLRARLLLDGRLRAADRERWTAFWLGSWAAAHMLVLIAADGLEDFSSHPDPEWLKDHFCWGVSQQGGQRFVLRAAWAAARLSKVLLPAQKQRFAASVAYWSMTDAAVCMAAITGARARVRAEVLKKLRMPAPPEGASAEEHMRHIIGGMGVEAIEADEAVLRAEALELGRRHHHATTANLASDNEFRFATKDAIPEALATAALFDCPWSAFGDYGGSRRALRLAPTIGRLAAEDLYYPKKYHAAFARDLNADTVEGLIAPRRTAVRPPKTVRAPARLGPNEPCTCGSGKKYKRCCASPK
ncbi:MAG: SEC-C metal-binding domain-containing protein [Polyangiales bacterium]